MAPPTSLAWSYFTVRDYGMAECHLCRKFIRIIKNTSPLIAHLRCKHPEVLTREKSGSVEEEVEVANCSTQTCEEDFPPLPQQVKEEPAPSKEDEMNLRMREMMALRLEDAMGEARERTTTNPMAQLLRSLCESCLWMIRDWPSQKMTDIDAVRASRLDTLGRLKQLLRNRPPKYSEMDGLTLLLADAMLTITEQWPGGEEIPPVKPEVVVITPSVQRTQKSTSTVVRTPEITRGCRPPAPKQQRLMDTPLTIASHQLSTSFIPSSRSASKPQRETPQGVNAGTPSRLWTFFTKSSNEPGMMLAKCALCNKMIPRHNYGTSDMKNHLRSNHPAEYASLGMEAVVGNEKTESPSAVHAVEETVVKIEEVEEEEEEKVPVDHSAAIAASSLQDTGSSLFFDDTLVKEEEMDLDESLIDPTPNFDEPTTSSQTPSTSGSSPKKTASQKASDIWTYFRKEESRGDKYGKCTLCDWRRKIHNHGTNTMWSHLRSMHPPEYNNLATRKTGSVATVHAVPEGGPVPSHLTLPRPPN